MTARSGIRDVLSELLRCQGEWGDPVATEHGEEFDAGHAAELGGPAGGELAKLEQLDGGEQAEIPREGLGVLLEADKRLVGDFDMDSRHHLTLRPYAQGQSCVWANSA